MRAWFFSEMAYPDVWKPEFPTLRNSLPSSYFDPEIGKKLLNRHLDEWMLADELGMDVMTNEHHSTATCLAVSPSVITGILARQTKRARILALGHAISNRPDPVRVAEETALVDVISGGRLEVGLIRGTPTELTATNSNPARMHERFWEAHDLILKAWTTHDGPFSWQGEHFQHRNVNIWPRPYQQPHPPVWISGSSSQAGRMIAERGHVYAIFFGGFRGREWLDAYRKRYSEVWNAAASPDRLACMIMAAVGSTDEEGRRRADVMRGYLRTAPQVLVQYSNPPGYLTPEVNAHILRQASSGAKISIFQIELSNGKRVDLANASVDELIDAGVMFAGSPDTVFKQLCRYHDDLGGIGHLVVMGQAGELSAEDTVDSMSLFAREVLPRFSEYARESQAQMPVYE